MSAPSDPGRRLASQPFQRQTDRRASWWRRSRALRHDVNLPLLVGLLVWLLLYLLVVYGSRLAPHDQYFQVATLGDNRPPFPPGPAFPLGSDQLGRDILSWLLIGARPTLLLALGAALLRGGIALPLGLFAGWRLDSWSERVVTAVANVAGALPAVVAAMLTLLAVGVSHGAAAFLLALAAFGWSGPMLITRRLAVDVAGEGYVRAARALGAREGWLVRRHVLPNVLPGVLPLLLLQVAACLLLLTELGFLQLFLGGGLAITHDTVPGFEGVSRRVPVHPEWGGLLAQNQPLGLLATAPWIVLAPLAGIVIAILGTTALANGLTRAGRRRSLGQLLPPRRVGAVVAVLALLAVPGLHQAPIDPAALRWANTFDGRQAAGDAATLAGGRFGDRAAGTSGADAAAHWLAGQFAVLRLLPAGSDGYLRPVTLPGPRPIAMPSLTVQRGQQTSTSGLPDVVAPVLPQSGGGIASGRLLFVGYPGIQLHGATQPATPIPPLAGTIAVLAPPTDALPAYLVLSGLDELRRQGAVAAIVVDDGPLQPYTDFAQGWNGPPPPRLPILKVSGRAAQTLLAGSGLTVQTAAAAATRPGFRPIPLAGQARVVSGFSAGPVATLDVAGLLPGTMPASGILVVAANYDRAAGEGDGSGTAVLLGLIRLLRERTPRPDILFVGLPGGPPGSDGLAAALATPPVGDRPLLLAVRLDDIGAGPLSLGTLSPNYHAAEVATAVLKAAGDLGIALAPTPLVPETRLTGSVPMDLSPQPSGPVIALAAVRDGNRPANAVALARAGRLVALLVARTIVGTAGGR